jgi:hypothetical protein
MVFAGNTSKKIKGFLQQCCTGPFLAGKEATEAAVLSQSASKEGFTVIVCRNLIFKAPSASSRGREVVYSQTLVTRLHHALDSLHTNAGKVTVLLSPSF